MTIIATIGPRKLKQLTANAHGAPAVTRIADDSNDPPICPAVNCSVLTAVAFGRIALAAGACSLRVRY